MMTSRSESDAHIAASPRFRGIRHAAGWDASDAVRNSHTNPPQGLLGRADFRAAFAELGKRGLTFDAWLYHPQIAELTALANAFPGTTIVLDHFGGPLGIGPYEGARVTVETSGRVSVATGIGTQGQGHYTSFAQIVSEQLGVPVERVRLVTGDTSEFYWGAGTFASRGAVVAGNAIHAAAVQVRKKVLKKASEVLGADEDDIELVDGLARVKKSPSKSISLGDLDWT